MSHGQSREVAFPDGDLVAGRPGEATPKGLQDFKMKKQREGQIQIALSHALHVRGVADRSL